MASKRKRASGDKKPKLELALDTEKQAEFEKKVKDIKTKVDQSSSEGRGVVYLKHIPHGFFEPQMKQFFSQFGTVTRLRLSRSKKSGNSKGYAFIEFEFEEVAKIVAETMNNYLMYHKLLKCKFIPKEKVWPDLFKGWNRMFKKPIAHKLALERHNSLIKNPERLEKSKKKLLQKQKRTKNRLRAMGIDWDFDGYSDPADDDTSKPAEESDVSEPPKKVKKDDKETTTPAKIIRRSKRLDLKTSSSKESDESLQTPTQSSSSKKKSKDSQKRTSVGKKRPRK
ncbi:MKI67 FHA domain-interacting nucleolar phosphoprotein-like [Glandiceps talaboti]